MKNKIKLIPAFATHPGVVLADELKSRGISQKDFALNTDLQATFLNEIIKGKRSVTADIAIILEKAIGIKADFWMRFQSEYEIDLARLNERNIEKTKNIEIWEIIQRYVPIKIFKKLGYLSNSMSRNIEQIFEIYNISSIDELIESSAKFKNLGYFKKSEKLNNDYINIFAWSKLAQWKVKNEQVGSYNSDNFNNVINDIKKVILLNENVLNEVKSILNNYGIKFIIQDKFEQTPIDGYSFWSNNNPAIAITNRKSYLDNFAFTIMHELGHIFKHITSNHSEVFIDIENDSKDINIKENEANQFALDCFINESKWKLFLKSNNKFEYNATESNIKLFALENEVHPSIIFGRYCYETNQYKIKTNIERSIN